MKRKQGLLMSIIFSTIVFGCRELYTPPVITTPSNYLVVEGLINTGTDSTIIKLSRTVSLNAKTTIKTETKAKVTVESDANASYPLAEIKNGTYASIPLGLSKSAKYRLRIITSDSKTYLSDFTEVRESPVIDSVGYYTPASGLQIYVNTHDATDNTRYYRWEYIETWNFRSAYQSHYIAVGTRLDIRTPEQEIYNCWATVASGEIVLASSSKLTRDVIYNTAITTVPAASEKLSLGYSVLVKQYALTQDAFNFWQNLKKNTEQLGSIFDAQPSVIKGNIHNINNAAEPVFGYVSAGTMQQKRLSVLSNSWPQGWGADRSYYQKCVTDTLGGNQYVDFYGPAPMYIAIELLPAAGMLAASPYCVDCTLRGSNKKPLFWPN